MNHKHNIGDLVFYENGEGEFGFGVITGFHHGRWSVEWLKTGMKISYSKQDIQNLKDNLDKARSVYCI